MNKKYKDELIDTLQLKSNHCTESIFIHPVRSGTLILYSKEDENEDKLGSLINLHRNQMWEAYYFKFAPNTCCGPKEYKGWDLTNDKKGICLRLCEKEFERYFGKYEILEEVE